MRRKPTISLFRHVKDASRMNSERLARSRTIKVVIICEGIFFVSLNLGVAHGQENSTTALRGDANCWIIKLTI